MSSLFFAEFKVQTFKAEQRTCSTAKRSTSMESIKVRRNEH